MTMRKLIIFTITLLLILLVSEGYAKTIYNEPDSYWWTGNPAADIAWKWVKDVNDLLDTTGGTATASKVLVLGATKNVNTLLFSGGYLKLTEIADPPADANDGVLYADTDNNIYYRGASGWIDLTAAAGSGVANLDEAYDGGGAGAGYLIDVDSGPVTLSNNDNDIGYLLYVVQAPTVSTASGGLSISLGANCSATAYGLSIANSGAGSDIVAGGGAFSVSNAAAVAAASLSTTATVGVGTNLTVTGNATMNGNTDIGNAVTDTLTITSIIDGDVTFDDGVGASPSLVLKDATDETVAFSKADSGYLGLTTQGTDGLQIFTGNFKVGNGTPTITLDGEDAYIEGTLENAGGATFTGAVTCSSTAGFTGDVTVDDQISGTFAANDEEIAITNTATNLTATSLVTFTMAAQDDQAYILSLVQTPDADADNDFLRLMDNATNVKFEIDQGGTTAWTLDAASKVSIDAATTENTGAAGALDIDWGSKTANSSAANITATHLTGGTGQTLAALKINLDVDSGNASDTLRGIDINATDVTATGYIDAIHIGGLTGIRAAFQSDFGYVRIGTGSTPDVTPGDDDLFVEGTAEIDAATRIDGLLTGTAGATISGAVTSLNADSNFDTNIGTGTSTGDVNIATGATAQAVNIGTGAGAKTIIIGSNNTTSKTTILGGISDSVAINFNAGASLTGIGNGSTTGEVYVGGGSNLVYINSSDWDINETGVATGFKTIGGDGATTIEVDKTGRFVFDANSEDLGFSMLHLNRVTLTTGSGVDTVDVNDADAWIGFGSIAGDGSQTIGFDVAGKIVFDVNGESIGLGVANLNTVKLMTDTGLNTFDFNDVNTVKGVDQLTTSHAQVKWTTNTKTKKRIVMPISYVSATEIRVGSPGFPALCTGLAGVDWIGTSLGYVNLSDGADFFNFGLQLPDDFVDTGLAADLVLEFDMYEQAAEQVDLEVRIFDYNDTTADITDTIVIANGAARGWVGLVTLSTGIGAQTCIEPEAVLMIEITQEGADDAEDVYIYGARLTYRTGTENTQ